MQRSVDSLRNTPVGAIDIDRHIRQGRMRGNGERWEEIDMRDRARDARA
jgi:hypothetical protein